MEPFFHVRILIGIIMGLSLTNILKNAIRPIQHPVLKVRSYWVHHLWGVYVFLLLVHFWWWEFLIHPAHQWNFARYVYLVIYAINYFILSSLLFPDDTGDYKNYKDYFYSRKNWFFGFLALSYLMDIADTLREGMIYLHGLGMEYILRNCIHIALCLVAIKVKDKRFHAALVMLFTLYQLSWIFRWFVNL